MTANPITIGLLYFGGMVVLFGIIGIIRKNTPKYGKRK